MANARDFVTKCMQVDPTKRPTAAQALKHPWFAPRPDDGQSVRIGASLAAFARLQRRVASLTVTDAPRRVARWLGRKAGKRREAKPQKQMFWELKLGMPPVQEEEDLRQRLTVPHRLLLEPIRTQLALKFLSEIS